MPQLKLLLNYYCFIAIIMADKYEEKQITSGYLEPPWSYSCHFTLMMKQYKLIIIEQLDQLHSTVLFSIAYLFICPPPPSQPTNTITFQLHRRGSRKLEMIIMIISACKRDNYNKFKTNVFIENIILKRVQWIISACNKLWGVTMANRKQPFK